MSKTFKVREHSHTFIPSHEIAYISNTFYETFREVWTEQMALTLALMIPGADPIQVTDPDCPFMRAANDIWYYMKEDRQHTYWDIRTQPIYGNDFIAIVYIRSDNHQAEIKYYKPRN